MYVSYYPYGTPTTLLPATPPSSAPPTLIPAPAHLPPSLNPADLYPTPPLPSTTTASVPSTLLSVGLAHNPIYQQLQQQQQQQQQQHPLPQSVTSLGGVAPIVICRKRGSEELMSHSPMIANGTGLSPLQSPSDLTDAKKAKLDGAINGPSRVVHIRSLPIEAGETDIVQLGMPFGKMTNVLVLKQKNQAFLEFADEACAVSMVNCFQTTSPPSVRGKPVFVQFSNHKELKMDASHAFQNANAQAALQAVTQVMGSEEQSTILRIIVDNAHFPVTLEILHTLFVKYGTVLKIITFTKNNTFQALIQMSDPIAAAAAKTALDGQNIYNGCNNLKIDFSKLTNLNVKYNNDKSRDFTRPDLPTGDLNLDAMNLSGIPGSFPSRPWAHGYGLPGVPMGTMNAMSAMGQLGLHPAAAALGAARIGLPLTAAMGSSVILVSNLDEETVTPDALFTLFGVYGDVHRVKVLFNKKDNALIQMADPHQAQLAITYLDKARVWGKQIRVAQSKHAVVQMPKEGQSDACLTKDFVNSPLHRFKRPGSKNCQNIFPPSQVLHLSNIPAHVTEENLTSWFTNHGTVKAFKFFPKDRKMALLQMSTVEEAIHALIAMHNYQMGESCHLRVSFSKSTF